MSNHSRQAADRQRAHSLASRTPLQRLGQGLEHWFHAHVFARPLAGLRGAARARSLSLRVVYLAARGFFEDQCLIRASALTYITVLSLVPMLAFSFAVAKGLGFYRTLLEDAIRPFLDRTFGPLVEEAPLLAVASEGAREMRLAIERVLQFVDQTNVSGLGAFGLVLLLYTVVKLLSTIEVTFNQIWGAHRGRSPVRKLTDYLAMLVVTPILLFVATGVTTAARNSSALAALHERLGLGPLLDVLVRLAPLFSLWVAFGFVYLAMPNARTRWSSALVGALVGGTLWQLVLLLHLEFQIGIARYNAIYAGFAAIPVFLIWVQVSWVTVLIGAEVCFAHQSASSYYPDSPDSGSLRSRERIALRVLARIGARSLGAQPALRVAELAAALNVSQRPLDLVLEELVAGGLLARGRGEEGEVLLLARDLDLIQVKTVLDVLRGAPDRDTEPEAPGSDAEIAACLVGLEEALAESRYNLPLRALAERDLEDVRGAARRASPGARLG